MTRASRDLQLSAARELQLSALVPLGEPVRLSPPDYMRGFLKAGSAFVEAKWSSGHVAVLVTA